MSEKRKFPTVGLNFIGNISSVRIFGSEIARLADEHDQAVAKEFVENLSKTFPELDIPPDSTVQIKIGPPPKVDTDTFADDKEPAKEIKIKSLEQGRVLLRTLRAFTKRAPVQGYLLRNGALVTLTSFFESLVSDLVHLYYAKHPGALPADARGLTLAELRALGSVEEAEQFLIAKEAESVIRESANDQLLYFSKRPAVDLSPLKADQEAFFEIFQRRNLLVHNSGVVNRYYCEKVSSSLIEHFKATEGTRLSVSDDYLTAAIDTVFVCGLILLQQCWRKWEKSDIEQVDDFLCDQLYDSLIESRFDLTERLSRYALHVPYNGELAERIALINCAIALKELNRKDEMEQILSKKDWSACATKFQLALCALRDDEEGFYKLLPKAIQSQEVSESNLKEWPLLNNQRKGQRFALALQKYFPMERSIEKLDQEERLAS